MQIEPPNAWEWMLLLLVGALAGAVNALRGYASQGTRQALLVGAVEGATALFATLVVFLVLHSFVPAMFGMQMPVLGAIGLSGAVAHIGLRQTIRLVLRIAENTQQR